MLVPRILLKSKTSNARLKSKAPVMKKFPCLGCPTFLDQTVTDTMSQFTPNLPSITSIETKGNERKIYVNVRYYYS